MKDYEKKFMLISAEHEIFLLINVKMPTIVGILTSMSRQNNFLCLSEPKTTEFLGFFCYHEHLNVMLSEVEHEFLAHLSTKSSR